MKTRAAFSALLLIVMLPDAVSGGDFYRSNPLGMLLEPLPLTSPAPAGYTAETGRSDSEEYTRLYLDGVLQSETLTLREGRKSTVKKKSGSITEIRIYEGSRLLSEEFISPGGVSSTVYGYSGGKVVSAEYSENGVSLYTDRYGYNFHGGILDVARINREENRPAELYAFAGTASGLEAVWSGTGDDAGYQRYDGRMLVLDQTIRGGAPVETREKTAVRGGILETVTDEISGKVVKMRYDDSGRLLSETAIDPDGTVTGEIRYGYLKGLLDWREERDGRMFRRYVFEYDSGGEIGKESMFENGDLVQEILYTAGEMTGKIFYRRGRAVLSVDYADGKQQ